MNKFIGYIAVVLAFAIAIAPNVHCPKQVQIACYDTGQELTILS